MKIIHRRKSIGLFWSLNYHQLYVSTNYIGVAWLLATRITLFITQLGSSESYPWLRATRLLHLFKCRLGPWPNKKLYRSLMLGHGPNLLNCKFSELNSALLSKAMASILCINDPYSTTIFGNLSA